MRMGVAPILGTAIALVLVLFAPTGQAHGASPPEAAFTRLLADVNDDCGGDAGAATGGCKGSHDLLAIDVQEKWQDGGDVMVFRFWLDKGRSLPITDTLSFNSPSGVKSLAFRTTDDSSFTAASGFQAMGQPQSLGDGARFTIDGMVGLDALGLKAGDAISDFKLESRGSSGVGDYMPGGCHNVIGECAATDTSTVYTKTEYRMQGASYYATLTPEAGPSAVAVGSTKTVMVGLENKLADSQSITIRVNPADGVEAGLHSGSFTGDGVPPATLTVDVPAHGTSNIHLMLKGVASASGALTVTWDTDRGGHGTATVHYRVDAGSSGQGSSDENGNGKPQSKGSPAPAAGILVALLALAVIRRR